MHIALSIIFLLCSLLLIMLILIQKGRGAGLAGAFGGAGGHSAFGTKTADILTKITAGLAVVFFLLSIVTAAYLKYHTPESGRAPTSAPAQTSQPAEGSQPVTPAEKPATGGESAPAAPAAPAAPTGGAPTEKSGG